MSEGVESSEVAANGGYRWLVIDIVLVLALTFGLHLLMTRTLSGPMLWGLYYPVLLMMVLGYLLARRRRLPTGVSPRLLSWGTAMLSVGAATGLVAATWLLLSGLAYLTQLAVKRPRRARRGGYLLRPEEPF